MKILLAAMPVITGDIEHNLSVIIDMIANFAEKADLLLFGETALQGFDSLCWDFEKDCEVAVSQTDEPVRLIQEAAKAAQTAVSFGYIEREQEYLYSSQLVIGADGQILHNFRRVSAGWKEPCADWHYAEGKGFTAFSFGGRFLAIGLCGDLWTEGCPEEMRALGADIVLWPVWCDYNAEEWNTQIKQEYAEQAALCGKKVVLVNPLCADEGAVDCAAGGAAYFSDGKISKELPAGAKGSLLVVLL